MRKNIMVYMILAIFILVIVFCINYKVFAGSEFTVNVGEEISLEVSNINSTQAIWIIEDSNIAEIVSTQKGGIQIGSYCIYSYSATIKGKNKGTTTLKLQIINGSSVITKATGIINVTNNVTSVKLNKESIDMAKGKQYQLKTILEPQKPDEIDTMTWTSLDKNIATVDNNGLVRAVNYGTTKIKVKIGEKEAYCTVNVKLPFTDIKENEWYYDSIKYVYENGMILGKTNTLFKPNDNLTRGQLVTILWRMEGSKKIEGNIFPDVKSNQYYYDAVKWAVKNGVVNGYNDGTFKPNADVSRQQVAVILMNYAKFKKKGISKRVDLTKYTDYKKISNYAPDSISWAIATKIMSGKENGTKIDPQGTATRAQIAAMLTNYCRYVGR